MNRTSDDAKEKTEQIVRQANADAQKEAAKNKLQLDRSVSTDTKLPPPIIRQYGGSRTWWTSYHPAIHGTDEFAFDRALPGFYKQWNEWWAVVELYHDEMVLSERVTLPSLKKDLSRLMKEIIQERDCYLLEALSEALWSKEGAQQDEHGKFLGKSEKTERHEIPYKSELVRIAQELRALDCGLTLGYPVPRSLLTRHGWGG